MCLFSSGFFDDVQKCNNISDTKRLKIMKSLVGEAMSEWEFPQLPAHLSEYRRDTLLIQPEDVVEKSHMSGSMFNLYLHQNYVDFFFDIDDVVRASDYLSTADVLCGNWSTRFVMEKYSASVATRGVIHSNTSRGFAHQQGGMGFRPLHKPQWFFINKKYLVHSHPSGKKKVSFYVSGKLPCCKISLLKLLFTT
ncbi:cell cycle checkpoint protein RAD17-like [Rhynochetos jubatus]